MNYRNTFAFKTLLGAAVILYSAGAALAAIPIAHWSHASGAQVYLVQSLAIPMVDVQIDFDAGSRRDSPAQAGLAGVTAGMADKGVLARGTEPALDENALGEAWADLGAAFGAHASNDRMSFSLRSLTYPELLGKSVQLAARQLGEPAFPEVVWVRERERIDAALREANTRPGTLAGRAFASAVYGRHPYGFEMTPETLARIDVADMKALYGSLILPCRAKVTLVGAIDRNQADALVTVSPDVMGGAAVFTGTRVPIDIVLGSIATGSSMERLRASYPFLTDAHVQAARVYEAVHPRRGRPRRLADTNPAMTPRVRRVVRPATV